MIIHELIEPILQQVYCELERLKSENLIILKREGFNKPYSKSYAKHNYERFHNDIAVRTIEAQEQLIFSYNMIRLDQSYYGKVNIKKPLEDEEIIQEIIREKHDISLENIDGFIHEFISSKLDFLPRILSKSIEKLKNSESFPCIRDEKIIIKNLIKHYKFVINSSGNQIDFFGDYISLNKGLSDLIANGILLILSNVYDLMLDNEDNEHQIIRSEASKNVKHKLIWQGKQKELIELLAELQDKGWILEIPHGRLHSASKNICSLFDLTGTKKSDESDEVKSFHQSLKGDLIGNQRNYERIYGKRYIPKFNQIVFNQEK